MTSHAHTTSRTPAGPAPVRETLAAGEAVVLPNPAPLTYVVTATRSRAVNEAKGRDANQPVALWAHHPDTLDTLDRLWDLTPQDRTLARRLLGEEHLTVLLPLRPGEKRPAWLTPGEKDGWVLLFGARWKPLRSLLDEHPVLYVSSANRTGHPPAATVEEALAMFPATIPVLQIPASTDTAAVAATARQATTTVRLHPDSRLELHRNGAQDQDYGDADTFLAHLRARYKVTAG
ncbi:Sua5/YciO/YrdC/YwlC family protein [Streptomyces sp. NBC_01104]|uniref:Sua5/YciO/YrdC/YwlC family protein n=1 Tax=Streptomyces sp. NBC_01104 TaxID=2903750 RepID=UPI00386AFB55|nr:Sua5/YciO/YrdC/YwlC family protein [Streptomyces sp. NBC_01104]